MLVWDSFRTHLSKPIRRTLQSLNTECAVIPGGMTGILQPLDVCIKKPFKDHLSGRNGRSQENTLSLQVAVRAKLISMLSAAGSRKRGMTFQRKWLKRLSASVVLQMQLMEPRTMIYSMGGRN